MSENECTVSMAPASPIWPMPAEFDDREGHGHRSIPNMDDQQRAGGGEQERRCHPVRDPRHLERQLDL